MSKETIENGIAAVASKATYSGAGMSVGGWFLSSEFAVLTGILIGLIGLAVNWHYKAKRDKREQLEHFAKMKSLK